MAKEESKAHALRAERDGENEPENLELTLQQVLGEKNLIATELRQRNRELEAIKRIAETLSNTFDVDAMIRDALDVVLAMFDLPTIGWIHLYQPRDSRLRLAVERKHPPNIERNIAAFPLRSSLAAQVAESRTTLRLDVNHPSVHEMGGQTFICAPLVAGEVIGAISVLALGDNIDEDAARLLGLMAAHIAAAVKNANLYTQIAEELRQLTKGQTLDSEPTAQHSPSTERVMIVDDNEDNLELLAMMLQREGYDVVTADNGAVALSIIERTPPDLLLLDLMMPNLDGHTVALRIRQNPALPFIPIIIVTAKADMGNKIMSLEQGADDYLTKPINYPELLARVRALLRLKQSQDALAAERNRSSLLYKEINRLFNSYVPTAVAKHLLNDPEFASNLGGTRQMVSVMFADLRGFSSYAESSEPEQLLESLNTYLGIAADAVNACGGTIDKFMGDAVMALFNAPLAQPDHALRAVTAGLLVQRRMAEFYRNTNQTGSPKLQFGVGINTGEAIVGNIGTAVLRNYTAIGDAVNLARRLEESAPGGNILIGELTYDMVRQRVKAESLGSISIRGRLGKVAAYRIQELSGLVL